MTATASRIPPPDTATLMLLDTYGLVYRAFFALPVMTTATGMPTNAAYGFIMMLQKVLADERPTHVIAAFDKGVPRVRIERYAEYKANRQETPDDLRSQFALVRKVLAAYDIPIVEIDGEEADDIIATLAKKSEEAHQSTLVVTGDLDLLQVVDDRTTVLMTRRGITDLGRYDEAAVRERFNLEPSQLADYRGLKGDPSDNLPGIPGVGEKTASKLINAAGTLDALVANPALAGTPKLEGLVRDYGAQAQLCRDVSQALRDLPVDIDWDHARYAAPGNDTLYVLYRELEFKSLLAKLETPKDTAALESAPKTLAGKYTTYVADTDPPNFARLATNLRELAKKPRVAIALKPGMTDRGLLPSSEQLGITADEGTGISFLVTALGMKDVGAAFAELWTGKAQIVVHDAKALIVATGSQVRHVVDDTMIAAHLLNPARAYTKLSDACEEHLGFGLPEEAAAWSDAVWRLSEKLRHELAVREQIPLYEDLELPLATILAHMEAAGIKLDPRELTEMSGQIDARVGALQEEVYGLAGETFNLGSPLQLGRVLFEKLGIPGGKKTKTGWATGIEVLQGLAREYPICARILEYREVSKLKNTYVDVLPSLADANGRVHTVFNQTSTATGRLSSTNPNLQNIPVRSELGRRVRKAFVAPSREKLLLAADYSQIELRLMAHLSGDAPMRQAFAEGQDIHDFTARQIFGVPKGTAADPNQRRIAKSVNFGLLYGMSEFGLSQRLEISKAEARQMTDAYFARFPSVRAWIDGNLEEGREKGYVTTLLGRRRYFPDLRARNFALRAAAEREATNAPLQGSAADLMKLAMVKLDAALRAAKLDAVMLLQIHDELIFEIAADQREQIARLVKGEMESAMQVSVPIEATIKIGSSWYDIAAYDPDQVAAGGEEVA
ncbi:MAG: DNA polymerase I [Vulcanimicrobiaceae bacterium]